MVGMADRMERRVGAAVLTLVQGDITRQAVDAVVNAANTSLLGGGGVDGAIHRAAGPALLAACRDVRAKQGGCPTGHVVATPAGRLQARWVFHAVGPRWSGGNRGEDDLLVSAYRGSMALARLHGARTVAFPSISTGIFGFPVRRAAWLCVRTLVDELGRGGVDEARMVLFTAADLEAYREALPPAG